MSTSTFLEICNEASKSCEITEARMTSVVEQIGAFGDIVRWVRDADLLIQREAYNWDFLYTSFSASTVQGTASYSKPSNLGEWDRNTVWLNRTAATNKQLEEMEYYDYFNDYAVGVQTEGNPDFFVVQPSGDLFLFNEPDAAYTLTANYWKAPLKMTAGVDTSVIPEAYLRCIHTRVEMFYYKQQEINDLYKAAEVEYKACLNDLKANQLRGWKDYNLSDGADLVVIPQ